MTPLLCSLFFSLCAASQNLEADPLFQKMLGQWVSKGTRHFSISGREVVLSSETKAIIAGDRLVSESRWHEQYPGEAKPRHYLLTYWIKPGPSHGEYDLGSMDQLDRPAAAGWLENDRFVAKQKIEATPPLMVESTTLFAEGTSDYFETVWHGETRISEARIFFTRIEN